MKEYWWKNAIIYQIYPKSFSDKNHDGIGDIPGIIDKLDYFVTLGVDTLWISPVYKSPMDDNGYDISDYQDIADEFGTIEDMKQLISEAAKKDIKIIMDLVVNHTSDEHDWFINSKESKNSEKRDWYIWKDPNEDGTPPNNLRSIFGGSCWEMDEKTKQYYFHSFSKKQPDLNWENSLVREAIYKMIRWWMDLGISGFRVDAITFIKKPSEFKEMIPDGPDGMAIVQPNHPGIGEYLKEMKERAFSGYDILTVAEAPGVSKKELPEFSGPEGYFSMLIEFDHVDMDIGTTGKWYEPFEWDTRDFKNAIDEGQRIVNHTGWTALYLENHDQPRSLNKYIPDEEDHNDISAKLLATMYFLLKGTPFIYQGQEIGMRNAHYDKLEQYNDLSTIDQYQAALSTGMTKEQAFALISRRSRDNARTPMQWNSNSNGGFSNTAPWLETNHNYEEINVEQAMANEDSVWHYYKQLINLRKNSEYSNVLLHGRYEEVELENREIFAYRRCLQTSRLFIIGNFSKHESTVTLDSQVRTSVLGNYSDIQLDGHTLTLRPFEAVVLDLSAI